MCFRKTYPLASLLIVMSAQALQQVPRITKPNMDFQTKPSEDVFVAKMEKFYITLFYLADFFTRNVHFIFTRHHIFLHVINNELALECMNTEGLL